MTIPCLMTLKFLPNIKIMDFHFVFGYFKNSISPNWLLAFVFCLFCICILFIGNTIKVNKMATEEKRIARTIGFQHWCCLSSTTIFIVPPAIGARKPKQKNSCHSDMSICFVSLVVNRFWKTALKRLKT